jgi:transposase
LGIDIACRAAHQVSLADEQGRFIWTGRRFRTTPQDLASLWSMLPYGTDPGEVLVVMEPTRNAWVPLAAWFRRRGASVVLVPPERSADPRRYYAKHTKSDRLDSQLLARLPMLHPDGLYADRFCYRHSRGAWGEPHADALLAAANQTLDLWADGDLDYPDLAEDIAIEARLALQLTEEIKDLDERTTLLLNHADPTGIVASAPGVATITATAILGRLGDPNRFTSLAGARAFTGLVPTLDASGLNGRHGGPTKRGDAVLREALFMAAGQARRIDPTLAAKYHRLMVDAGKHHNSALCHIATTLLTRIIACWRAGQPYILRDIDGTPVTKEQARTIIAERYTIPKDLRARRRTTHPAGTDRRSKESQNAPSTGPSKPNATTTAA